MVGDYFEDSRGFSVFKNKGGSSIKEVAYSLYCCTKIGPNSIYDRSFLSSLFYSLIFSLLNAELTLREIEDFCTMLPTDLWSYWGGARYIILIDGDADTVLTRMTRRANNVDLATDYGKAQEKVFLIVAKYLDATFLIKSSFKSMS